MIMLNFLEPLHNTTLWTDKCWHAIDIRFSFRSDFNQLLIYVATSSQFSTS